MLERSERILRIACVCLVGLLAYQFASLIARKDPLAGLKVPAVPTLASGTNAAAGGSGTNSTSGATATPARGSTNSVAARASAGSGTNPVVAPTATRGQTNATASLDPSSKGTNALAERPAGIAGTNLVAVAATNLPTTNIPTPPTLARGGTNAGADAALNSTGAVSVARRGGARGRGASAGSPLEMAMAGAGPMRGGGARRGPELPPAVQARVDRITESELLAPVIRPQPMALLGIAGTNAFLRAPNGQTGMIKEGDDLGGVKLVRIGVNRVLVEEDGQKKELMIFQGYGGESLLPKEKDKAQ